MSEKNQDADSKDKKKEESIQTDSNSKETLDSTNNDPFPHLQHHHHHHKAKFLAPNYGSEDYSHGSSQFYKNQSLDTSSRDRQLNE